LPISKEKSAFRNKEFIDEKKSPLRVRFEIPVDEPESSDIEVERSHSKSKKKHKSSKKSKLAKVKDSKKKKKDKKIRDSSDSSLEEDNLYPN